MRKTVDTHLPPPSASPGSPAGAELSGMKIEDLECGVSLDQFSESELESLRCGIMTDLAARYPLLFGTDKMREFYSA